MALYVSIGLAIPSWFFAMQIPNQCGMATAKEARFGMRQHVWEEPLVKGRRRRRRDTRFEAPAGAKNGPIEVEIIENAKSRVTFRCMLLTTFCTLVPTGLTLATAAF